MRATRVVTLFATLAASSQTTTLWRTPLGANATLAFGTQTSVANFESGCVLLSPDASTIYVTEMFYAGTVQCSVCTPRILALDAATGAQLWAWLPTFNAQNFGSSMILSADGETMFVVLEAAGGYTYLIAAVSTASGAVLWQVTLHEVPEMYSGYGHPFNLTLPSLSASGDLCLVPTGNTISCLNAATGVPDFTISVPSTNGFSAGFDATRSYIITSFEASGSSNFAAYETVAGGLLWNVSTPEGTALSNAAAIDASATALFAVVANTATNSASLYCISLQSGTQPAGFPVALPNANFVNTLTLQFTPDGSLLLTRDSNPSLEADLTSLALLDASTGEERWVWMQPAYPFGGRPKLSPDGAVIFASGMCGVPDHSSFELLCTNGAKLYALSTATGALIAAVDAGSNDVAFIYPVVADSASGGVLVSWRSGLSGSLAASVGAVSSDGTFTWSMASAPLPAWPLSFASAVVREGTVVLFDASHSSDPTNFLMAISTPVRGAPSAPAAPSASIAIIIGSALGGAVLVAVAAAVIARRCALCACLSAARRGGDESLNRDENTSLLYEPPPGGAAISFMSTDEI